MRKNLLYTGIVLTMITMLIAGCGSAADKSAGTSQETKTEKKQADFDEIQVGLTKDELVKTYGEPEETISDNTEVIQGLTTDMTELQADLADEEKQQKVVTFFGGSEENMQEALTDMLDTASEGMELLKYTVDGKEINVYIVGGKVLLRTF